MTGREYLNGNLMYCITSSSASKNNKITGAKKISYSNRQNLGQPKLRVLQ